MYACAPKDIYIPPSDNIVQQLESLDQRKVPKRYYQLIARCLNKDHKQRPTTKEIVAELDFISEKLCVVCCEAARAVRLLPCGHNVLCRECFQQVRLRQNSSQPQCIICKQAVTGIQEDNDASTFIKIR